MHDVNWWLMALAFILGLLLTLFLLIRRVKREVPEYATFAAGAGAGGAAKAAGAAAGGAAAGGAAAKLAGGAAKADADDDPATLRAPKIDADGDNAAKPGAVAAGAAAAAAGGAAAAKFADTSTEKTEKFSAVTDEP